MTEELHKRIKEATETLAKARVSVQDLAAAMRKTAKAMLTFRDFMRWYRPPEKRK